MVVQDLGINEVKVWKVNMFSCLISQVHDGKTPTLRGTFSGDYWNSNILTVTYIGSAVASTGNIRQLTAFDSKLTGQDPTWK